LNSWKVAETQISGEALYNSSMIPIPLTKDATNGEKYLPAMKVETEAEATAWLEVCIQHAMQHLGKTRQEAEVYEKKGIALAAFYGFHESEETIQRLARLFHIEAEFGELRMQPFIRDYYTTAT
jgi:hypothetical protein